MDRRGFLKSLLGVVASAALPAQALTFLEENAALPDVEFVDKANADLIDLISMRFKDAQEAMVNMISADLFNNAVTDCGVAQSVERWIVNPLVDGSSPSLTANFATVVMTEAPHGFLEAVVPSEENNGDYSPRST